MSKFIYNFAIVAILFIPISSTLAKGQKPKQPANSSPAKIVIPRVNSSKSRSVSPDILKAIETGKKYRGTPIKEKSQLETQSQYEARVAASQPTDIQPIDLSISVDKTLRYNAEQQFATISIEEISDLGNNHKFEILKEAHTLFQYQDGVITCVNGYGSKFKYSHTEFNENKYAIAYSKQNLPEADEYIEYGRRFGFKVPMSNDEVRNYVTVDEKEFNGRLKFIVKIRPTAHFYQEASHHSGDPCPRASKDATSLQTSSGQMYYALFEIQSLKLVDSLTGKIFIERSYPLVKK